MATKASKAPKRRGRPKGTATGRNGRRIELYLSEETISKLDSIGEGNKSLGVQRAVEAMR